MDFLWITPSLIAHYTPQSEVLPEQVEVPVPQKEGPFDSKTPFSWRYNPTVKVTDLPYILPNSGKG